MIPRYATDIVVKPGFYWSQVPGLIRTKKLRFKGNLHMRFSTSAVMWIATELWLEVWKDFLWNRA